jgi:hypothetical protein
MRSGSSSPDPPTGPDEGPERAHPAMALLQALDRAEVSLQAAEHARDLAYEQVLHLVSEESHALLLGRVHANLNACAAHCMAAAARCLAAPA